jgi:hypothetical protein
MVRFGSPRGICSPSPSSKCPVTSPFCGLSCLNTHSVVGNTTPSDLTAAFSSLTGFSMTYEGWIVWVIFTASNLFS